MNSKMILQAEGEFPFTFFIEKAVPKEEDGLLIVEGVASTVNVDHDNERMAETALQSMANIINDKGVPLRLEHNKEDQAIVGNVYRAWVDERNQLWVRAAIDPQHPAGPVLHDSLKQGVKFGLSVGGRVKNAVREMVESTGKMVKTFYDVILDEVSVTRRPANYDAWLFAKSYKGKDDDVTPFYSSPLYKEFLFENENLDYLRQFAKSVPDKAWKRVTNINLIDKHMKKEEEKKDEMKDETKKAEEGKKEEEGTEKSFVTKAQFTKFAETIGNALKAILTKMEEAPKDTTNPNKDKEKQVGDEAEKSREGQEDAGGNGGDEKKESAEAAHDQDNPGKDKEENVGDGDKAKKSEDKEEEKEKSEDKKDEEEKEKSEGDKDKDEEKEKSEKKDDEDETNKGVDSAIKSIESMTKRLNGEKVAKSEEKVEKSEHSSMDRFAASLALALEALESKFEKTGTRVPGLRDAFLDLIRTDASLQKEIAAMVKEPGFKKSVSMGVPYMVTKDGKKFSLSASPIGEKGAEEMRKSREGKSFKDVYKSEYSAFGKEEAGA